MPDEDQATPAIEAEGAGKAAATLEAETSDVTTQVTKKLSVTFSNGLPMGTCARFKHDGEIWIAYPSKKMARITTVVDRFLGILERMTDNTIRILGNHPGNPAVQELAVATLGSVEGARQKWHDLSCEKIKAVTS